MNTHATNTTTAALGADDKNSKALNYYDLLIEDFRLHRQARVDALIEAVYKSDNPDSITSDTIKAAHRYMLHLLNTKTKDYVNLNEGTVKSVKLATDALNATRTPHIIS